MHARANARALGCPYTSIGGELRKGKTPHPRVVPSCCLLGMKRFSIRVVCSIRSGEGSARGGCSKRSYCSEAAGHVTGEGEREGGEGRRSPLFLPTVSIPDDLQKALKKVLERELIICHHPVIPISRDLRSSMKILTPEFIRSVLLSLSLSSLPCSLPDKTACVGWPGALQTPHVPQDALSCAGEQEEERTAPSCAGYGELRAALFAHQLFATLSLSLSHTLSLSHSHTLSLSHSHSHFTPPVFSPPLEREAETLAERDCGVGPEVYFVCSC